MRDITTSGSFTKTFVTDIPADLNSDEYMYYDKTIPKFPNQAIYIYSFLENKMIFASGWKDILGYEDDEMSMLKFVSITNPKHMEFTNDLNDKALMFMLGLTKDVEDYSVTLEVEKIHKDGNTVPLFSRIGVHKSVNGKLAEIIGISQVMPNLKFGDVMQYAAYGPETAQFEETLNKELFHHIAISRKEKEALMLISEGHSYKEVADILCVSQSAIEKRIRPMFKRFNVNGLAHLVSFAKDNHIL